MTQPKTKAEWTARRDELQEVVAAKKDALQTAESKAAQHRLLTGQADDALDSAADTLRAQLQRDEIAVQLAGEQIAECERADEQARREGINHRLVERCAAWVDTVGKKQKAVRALALADSEERRASLAVHREFMAATACLSPEQKFKRSPEIMSVSEPLVSLREATIFLRTALALQLGHSAEDWGLQFLPEVSRDGLHRAPADEYLLIRAEAVAGSAIDLAQQYTGVGD